jgi:hypothetical protein
MALIVPAVCYGVILLFGWFARQPLKASAEIVAANPEG